MDYKKIQEDFNKVIQFSQDYDYPITTDKLFKDWFKNKERFINKFGGLIYELPTKVSIPVKGNEDNEKLQDFYKVLNRLRYEYPDYLGRLNDLYTFITLNPDGFKENKLTKDYNYYDTIIPKGMKMIKAFKKFIPNKEILKELQIAANTVHQNRNIEGTLCISVHPLDYLSISENNEDWTSCHTLDGDYRAGNLSYMADSSTVVVYIKSDENEILPNFPDDVPWNSKKWRILLYVSEDFDLIFQVCNIQRIFLQMKALVIY